MVRADALAQSGGIDRVRLACHDSAEAVGSFSTSAATDVYFGRGPDILKRKETIKRKTIEQRRRLHQQAIAA
jgi:hypothetical protein